MHVKRLKIAVLRCGPPDFASQMRLHDRNEVEQLDSSFWKTSKTKNITHICPGYRSMHKKMAQNNVGKSGWDDRDIYTCLAFVISRSRIMTRVQYGQCTDERPYF